MKKSTKWALGIGGAIVVAVGGYLYFRKKDDAPQGGNTGGGGGGGIPTQQSIVATTPIPAAVLVAPTYLGNAAVYRNRRHDLVTNHTPIAHGSPTVNSTSGAATHPVANPNGLHGLSLNDDGDIMNSSFSNG